MPTPAERRALLFVATVAALGIGVRGCRTLAAPDIPANDRESLARQIAAVDSAVASGGRKRPTKAKASPPAAAARVTMPPAGPQALVDVDRAPAAELDQLPGIGPALAARIAADREANGAFGSLQELQRVKGIGPALAAKLAPFVTFSAPPRHTRAVGSGRQDSHP